MVFLFGKKKAKPREPLDLPPLDLPEFPRYESKIPPMDLKEAVGGEEAGNEEWPKPIPVFKPGFEIPMRKPIFREFREMPVTKEEPLFVKIDKYKEVMNIINSIKVKLKEAEAVLAKLNELKVREEKEIANWHESIESLKEKLLIVDKSLFEVK